MFEVGTMNGRLEDSFQLYPILRVPADSADVSDSSLKVVQTHGPLTTRICP